MPAVAYEPARWRRARWDEPGTIYFWSGRKGLHRKFSMFACTPFVMPAWHAELGDVPFAYGEHSFHCAKTTTPADHEWIRNAAGPMEAKNIGRGRIRHPQDGHRVLLPPDWDRSRRFVVMLEVNRYKFAQGELRDLLLSTGTNLLAEDSPYDPEWGCRDKQGGYTGCNYLGRVLMRIRDELRAER